MISSSFLDFEEDPVSDAAIQDQVDILVDIPDDKLENSPILFYISLNNTLKTQVKSFFSLIFFFFFRLWRGPSVRCSYSRPSWYFGWHPRWHLLQLGWNTQWKVSGNQPSGDLEIQRKNDKRYFFSNIASWSNIP